MLADATEYIVATLAIGRTVLFQRNAARWNGTMLMLLGAGVIGEVVHRYFVGSKPQGMLIIAFALLSLIVNGSVLRMLACYCNSPEIYLRATWVDACRCRGQPRRVAVRRCNRHFRVSKHRPICWPGDWYLRHQRGHGTFGKTLMEQAIPTNRPYYQKNMPDSLRAKTLLQRGLYLEYMTLLWNVVGVVVVGMAAIRAHPVALAGFGLDSLIEIFASMVIIWHLRETGHGSEKKALRLIGLAFLALAAYLIAQTTYTFYTGGRPHPSTVGMLWLAATVIAMLLLAWGKSVTGRQLGNPVLIAESRVTVIDAYLAAAVLAGVALNAGFGWWWADPLSGLVVVYYAVTEGIAHWKEGRA